MNNKRIEHLRTLMQDKNIDAFLINNKANRYYVSGFTGTYGSVLIDRDSQYVIADGRYFAQLKQQAPDFDVIDDHLELSRTIANFVSKQNYKRIGIEANDMNVTEYLAILNSGQIKLIPTQNIIEQLRLHKDESEVKRIKKADAISDKAFEHIFNYIEPGMKEKEVANELDNYGISHGADSKAFETIVASGYRAGMPHGHASNKTIKNNEIVIIDFGFQYDHYYSDETRCIALGNIDSKIKEIYEIDREAQQAAIDSCEIGKPLKEIDQAARSVITKYGYGDYFLHGLGHGLGLTVHEYPFLRPSSKAKMEANMTFTTEPGIYLEGLGGVRIEDDILMSEDNKAIRLTHSSRKLRQK